MESSITCVNCLSLIPAHSDVQTCPKCGSKIDTVFTVTAAFQGASDASMVTVSALEKQVDDATPPTLMPPLVPLTLEIKPPTIEGYEFHHRVGHGGMGEVWEAIQKGFQRKVAVKVVRRHLSGEYTQTARFTNEARALGQLSHPHVVQVFDVGQVNEQPFFTMELMAGGSLSDLLRGGKQFTISEAVSIISSVALGVEAAHEANILHRDIKPGNILISDEGVAKIADFGLAKLLNADDELTQTGAVIGTPSYMAPEQVGRSSFPISKRTDVYGLGATLYHLLTGRPPFKGETPMATAHQVVTEDPPSVSTLCPTICPILQAIIQKAMSKNPDQRYASAGELSADLQAWSRGDSTLAWPLTRKARMRRWVHRHRAMIAAGLLLSLGIGASALAASRGPREVVKEVTPVEAIEQRLANGQETTLVGSDGAGPPAYHLWRTGDALLSPPGGGKGAFGFQTAQNSLLELVRDPMCNRYRIKAKLHHLAMSGNYGAMGMYVGYDEVADPLGNRFARFTGFEFNEFWDLAEQTNVKARSTHRVSLFNFSMTERVNKLPNVGTSEFDKILFVPGHANAPWRSITMDVDLDGITLTWDDGSKAQIPVKSIESDDKSRRKWIVSQFGQNVPPMPGWSPRRPLGLWARNSTVAVMDVVIIPNP